MFPAALMKADALGRQEWIVLLNGLQLKGSACPSEMITGVGGTLCSGESELVALETEGLRLD